MKREREKKKDRGKERDMEERKKWEAPSDTRERGIGKEIEKRQEE